MKYGNQLLSKLENTKIGIFNLGIKVSESARSEISGKTGKPISTGDYVSTSGVSLFLGDDIYVNAPSIDNNSNFVNDTPYSLEIDAKKHFYVSDGSENFTAEYIPVPGYWDKLNSKGFPYKYLAVTHIDRVRISPIAGCALKCHFCGLPYTDKYHKKTVDDLVDAVKKAVNDDVLPAKHVLISGGTPIPKDYEYLNEVYATVASISSDLPVDIMMAPVKDTHYGQLLVPRALKEYGIYGLAINLELYNSDIARAKAKGKFNIGIDEYLNFIEKSVEEFGPGRVRSLLMVGIEPLEDTLKGVAALAERGCDPVLSPFRPDPYTPLKSDLPPSIGLQSEAYLRAKEIVSRFDGVELGPRCIPCQHNSLAFPYKKDGTFHYPENY